MSKHTPGPWMWDEVSLPGLGPDRWCEVLNSEYGSAVVRHEASGGPTPWRIKSADARLIAAAPELLEALKQMRAVVWGNERQRADAIIQAEAAIAKAEGR